MNFLARFIAVSVVAIGLLVIGAKADAQEIAVGVHTVSHHTKGSYFDHEAGIDRKFNDTNPGVYLMVSAEDTTSYSSITVGAYKNSVWKTTAYASLGFGVKVAEPIAVGVQVGFGTGYNKSFGYEGSFVPVGGVVLTAKLTDKISGNVVFVPPIKKDTAGVVHLTLDHKF